VVAVIHPERAQAIWIAECSFGLITSKLDLGVIIANVECRSARRSAEAGRALPRLRDSRPTWWSLHVIGN